MKRLPLLLLVLCAIAFLGGLVHLFQLRFEAGDIYPSYSSLRADPLGTKAFLEGLDRLLEVERNFQPLNKLGPGRDRTLFMIGAREEDLILDTGTFQDLEKFATSGGRIVLSLHPSYQARSPARRWPPRAPTAGTNNPAGTGPLKGSRKKPPVQQPPVDAPEKISVAERWNFAFDHTKMDKTEAGVYLPAEAERNPDASATLPRVLPIHTSVAFKQLGPGWRSIYARGPERTVLMERAWGDGSIVLAADSYLFSNEAIMDERHPELLAWLVGSVSRAIFDETHLGVQENSGVASLLRKYRLHGFFAGLAALAILFVWKNSLSFMPANPESARDDIISIAGKESSEGFINLLRRNIPPQAVMSVCLQEWKKSCGHRCDKARLQKIQALIDAENQQIDRKRNPIELYRRIHQILARKL